MRRIWRTASILVLVLGLLLSACAPAAQPPTPAPVPTATPSVGRPAATPAVTLPTPTPAVARPAPTPAPTPGPAVEKPRYGGVLRIGLSGDISTFDPHTHAIAILAATMLSSYNNLIQIDPADPMSTRILGDTAAKWEMSPDGTAYTFYLQKGVKFHDGQPLTAADAKFSLDRIIFPPKGMPSPRKDDLTTVKSVEVLDDYTLKITLKYPSGSFLTFLADAWMTIVPKHLVEKDNDALKKKSLGSGPFMFKEYVRGVSYEAGKNPNYFKAGLPYLDGFKAYVIPDSAARLAALRTEQVLVARPGSAAVSIPERSVLLKEKGDKISSPILSTSTAASFFHLNNKWKPVQDVRVRKALSLGLNREAFFDVVWQGHGFVAGPMPAGGPWVLPKEELATYPGYGPDMKARIAEAKKLLAEVGYTEAKPLELEVITRADVYYFKSGAEFIVSELPKIGVKAKVLAQDQATYYANLEGATYQAGYGNHGVTSGDPDSLIAAFFKTKGGRNYAHVSDPKIDELYDKQARTLDPQKRKEMVWEIQRILLREAYWPVIGQLPRVLAQYKVVRGLIDTSAVSYHNVKYEDVWLAAE